MPRTISHPRYHGFTFVELMVGIIVTSIVLCALSVFTFGVSQNWTQSDSAQSVFLNATLAVERLNHLVRTAQMVEHSPITGSLDNSAPPATCMLWTDSGDGTGSTTIPDGKIEYSEMTLLQYDPVTSTIVRYFIPTSATNGSTYTSALLPDATFINLPNITSAIIADHVSACQFFSLNTTSTTQLASMEVVLEISSNNSSVPAQMAYTTATLRAPNPSPK